MELFIFIMATFMALNIFSAQRAGDYSQSVPLNILLFGFTALVVMLS